ncbi:hemopexin repeat-containing protein [Streptosporangium sp. NBC_01495]|uniref:hemopexin repeat-containing protein n=1 Tax=Streptosporangium sp. NBC_01495 TaxID=2903899 RepID=UPI002E2FD330|nr:hemopexin repeat-containing protein [Streptosporangium sp. NBC_01495]
MRSDASLPGYERLFGHLDLRAGDEARSVYSPAAYLTDLLTFLQETFHDVSLLRRRPGIGRVKLDADNTFTALPYLDIVNEVLEALVGERPYERLKTLKHPHDLPFSLDATRFTTYLRHLGVDPVEFYRLFAATVDPDRVTRDYLGLTPEDVDLISVPRPDAPSLAEAYGLGPEEPVSALCDVDRFLAATSLTGEELRDLLYQDPELERSRSGFWVHQGAVVDVGPDDRTLVLRSGGEPPHEWFDRAHRFVRLARRTGLSFTDLDRVAAGVSNDLHPVALRAVAAATHLHRTHDVPFDLIEALITRTLPGEIKDGPFPAGDILAPRNHPYRRMLARSIDLAETEIAEVVRRLRARHAGPLEESPFDRGIGRPGLVVLNRVARLTGALGMSVEELFAVLAALEADPAIERHSTFPVLPVLDGRSGDVHRMLESDEDPAASLWLAQTVFEVVAWMRAWGLTGEDLIAILGEPATPESEEEQAQVIAGIAERFADVALTPRALVSDRFDERAARVLYGVLTTYTDGVVSPHDPRLLRIDPAAVATAAYDAVGDLAVLAKGDFLGLGLGDRLTTKIFANLVIRNVVQADGLLISEDLPAELTLAGDFSAHREPLFGAIAELEGSFYPSDLAAALPRLTEADRAELYDNLVHNGYLTEKGEVLDPEVFADPARAAGFRVNAPLDDVAPAVLALLRERVEGYRAARIPLDPAAFGELRLTAEQFATLVESLRFNGVVDAEGAYRDKAALATLDLADLGIALEFHPVRRIVLAAMKAQLAAAKAEMHLVTPADFADLADEAMATRLVRRLEGVVTHEGRVQEELRHGFDDAEGSLDLGEGFTDEDGELAFERIAGITRAQAPYRLDLDALTELGFEDGERSRLVAMLVDAGHLTGSLGVPEHRLAYFRTVTSALDFTLPGVDDYARDVFFLLHAVAKEQTAAIVELAGTLGELAALQHGTLLTLLQDVFGVPGPVVEAIGSAVAPGALDVLVAPALGGGSGGDGGAGPDFRRVYRRLRRFARLAAKFGLDVDEVTVAFRDQDLTGKFPEPLALPPGHDRFDALLTGHDGLIYVFHDDVYWTYSAETLAPADSRQRPLTELSPHFAGLSAIDAAFTLPDGTEWIVGRGPGPVSRCFTREPGGTRWAPKEQVWGRVRNNFTAPKRIDGAYVDPEGRTHLFAGDQYLRYSGDDHTYADEGYPRAITEWWQGDTPLPEAFRDAVDAVFHGHDGRTYVLSGDRAFDGVTERPLTERWGRLRNTFDGAERVDAAYADAEGYLLFSGNQVVRYTDNPENDGVRVAEGYPRRIETWRPGVPVEFEGAVEAAFEDGSGTVHLFKDGKTVALGASGGDVTPTAERWGLQADVLPGGRVDAAFVGLDGRTYLFGGDRYIRYSGADYSVVDLGYPRAVTGDWGGLDRVDAAFVMDGSAHLFGPVGLILDLPAGYEAELADGNCSPALRRRLSDHGVVVGPSAAVTGASPEWRVTAEGGIVLTIRRAGDRVRVHGDDTPFHVRYSTRDHTTPDEGFPRPLAENWLNLPDAFTGVDAVLTGRDNQTYLFSGDRFVVFDNRHRWWSEPRNLRERWDSIPFDRVDAAFVGKDGKTYVFSGDRYVRYSTDDHTEIDDRYPATTATFWGNVVNTIQRTGRVDATLVMDVTEKVDGADVTRTYTYLFSGSQYVRYRDHDYRVIEDGYPRALSALAGEPRLGALEVTLDGVDAAFADRRTVYLFRGGEWHAVSDGLHRSYELPGITAAYLDRGSVMVQTAEGWRRQHALEGPERHEPVRPPALRAVPAGYRDGLDAVLTGADGNTYLFKGPMCFDTAVGRDYPLDEEWGRPRNTIYQDNTVDAAFVGRDGRTYLFSGDQFVVHGDPADSVDGADGEPGSIAEHWGGLTGVALAYHRDGTTHLFEHPGPGGTMRHLTYTGDEGPYESPDPGSPALVDETFWKAPDGFPVPDAVLFEGRTTVLLSGERCVRFNEATGLWSHPQPIERLWRGFTVAPGDRLKTAFTAADGVTHFFFTETFTTYADRAFTAPVRIRDRWGHSLNPFGSAVDAAVVFGGHTYVFGGSRYVRYTGPSYRYVDPGYPKPIVRELRREAAFAGLPESFDDAVAVHGVDAAVAGGRTAHLVTGHLVHAVSTSASATYPIGLLGRVRNTIADLGRVDAALVRDRHTFLFSGDQYVRYTGADYLHVDEGYPRTIEGDWGGLPAEFEDGVDAAFLKDGRVYFFKGDRFTVDGAVDSVAARFGRVRNAFATAPVIDAAFVGRKGELYAFAGDQYVRYPPGTLDHAEQGYPRTIKDDWGDLPSSFEEGVIGAFTLGEAVYLAKDDRYVRYSGRLDVLDRTFPQLFRHRWSDAADYRLTDMHTIVAFADLNRRHPGLAQMLVGGTEDPYERLCELFPWDPDELRWVKRNAGLITEFPAEEDRFEIEFLLKLTRLFSVAGRMGAGPSALRGATADTLEALLPEAAIPLAHDDLNVARRDALVPAVLHLHPGLATAAEIYEHALIDVEMGREGTTSRVREAIAATQLYLHRYLLDLEEPGGGEDVKPRLRTWWQWLRNYRTWEANRKVFLYPENYLRPELRDTRTPAFRELEDDLLQGEITADTVQRAYRRYLDEYTEVSRLAIAGAYVYRADDAADGTRRLVLFGRTRTDPRRWYLREAEFRDGERLSASWEPWHRVDVQIDADRVDPVHAFGRVFVFWSVVEAVAPEDTGRTVITAETEGDRQNVSAPPPKHRVRILYSFQNLNREWVAPQTLPPGPLHDGPITGETLFVRASATVPGAGTHDSIVVSCSYTIGESGHASSFALTPELYAVPIATPVRPAKPVDVGKVFAEPVVGEVVPFNMPVESPDGPWFSVDHKGGSFLVRPVIADPGEDPPVLELKGNGHRLPDWERVDAAFEHGDTRYFFNNLTGEFLVTKPFGPLKTTGESTAGRWGNLAGGELATTGRVDAVLVRGESTYVFTGREYHRYRGRLADRKMDLGYPRQLSTNTEDLPRWTSIDAAFTWNGAEYFLNGDTYAQRDVTSGLFGSPGRVRDKWPIPDRARVQAALVRGTTLFLIFGDTYTKVANGRQEDGYPRALRDNPDGLPVRIRTAADVNGTPYFFGDDTFTVGTDTTQHPTRPLGRIATALNTTGTVDAAYVSGDHLFLLSGEEYYRYTLDGADIPLVADTGYPKALPRAVDATFRRGDQRYLLSGEEYAVVPAAQEPSAPAAFTPIEGNWRSLPPGFTTRYTGAMDTASDLFLFLGGQYTVYPRTGVVHRPYEYAALPHEIVRLTSSTAFELNRRLLVGGVPALLAPETQEIDELPTFSTTATGSTTIRVRAEVAGVPAGTHLDFQSANGRYHWEIFFHAPLLIAQALNAAQRFADAKIWYEYVFDPTEQDRYWRFLPFLAIDLRALVAGCLSDLENLPPGVGRDLRPVLADVESLAPLFEHARPCTPADLALLDGLADRVRPFESHDRLREKIGMIARLRRQYDLMGDHGALLKAYRDDPFDPHAIAELRPTAYRRAVVMAYVDNVLDWGDLLFRQYTLESVDEARMLYILAYDLLGERPRSAGPRHLSPARSYDELDPAEVTDPYAETVTAGGTLLDGMGAVHRGVADPYFFIPGNTVLGDYWDRVEDRLRKIRASLDIMGVSRPLPLFEPPADVMALVRGAAAGLTPDQVTAGLSAPVPHHRFGFLYRRAQDLADRLRGFGGELLGVLERRDAEELTLLQTRQEGNIRQMTRAVREAQVESAIENLAQFEASREAATARQKYYENLVETGLTPLQQSQIRAMTDGVNSHFASSGLKIGAAIAYAAPQVLAGPFILGTMFGGEQAGRVLDVGSDIAQTLGEAFSVLGELYGVRVEQERQEGDWRYQVMLAKADQRELGHQITAARAGLAAARRELEIADQEIADLEAVATFLTGKFTNAELYRWKAGRLAAMYFASYGLAHEIAKAAERAYQYERGTSESYIQPVYWESRRDGLLAGEALAVDVERLGNAYTSSDSRGLEITKRVSLLQLDPLAVLALRNDGRCEFALTEELFDRDFPGHYRRRVKTVSIVFDGPEGPIEVNAVLTQTGHRTVLSPDAGAVRYLIDAKGDAPASIRSDWRPGQQIALSDTEQYRDNNGLFELRFDDERYLPFEGTGAVSTWRMEITGRRPHDLSDVTLLVKYTAEQGGDVFTNAVRGMRRPYTAARYIDVAGEFAERWQAFADGGDLVLPITPEMFPDMVGGQITGMYARYEPAGGGSARLRLNGRLIDDGKAIRVPGLRAEEWTLTVDGDRKTLINLGLVLTYRAV